MTLRVGLSVPAGFAERPLQSLTQPLTRQTTPTTMRTIEYTTIDKTNWGAGPWMNEPDKKQFVDPETGYPCLIKRHPTSGHLCGYVGVMQGHPSFGQSYSDAKGANGEWLEVHGGLTYAAFCQDTKNECEGICHVVEDGEDERVWWLGFDCAHCGDKSPGHPRWFGDHDEFYKDIRYVERECASLARQLKDAADAQPIAAASFSEGKDIAESGTVVPTTDAP